MLLALSGMAGSGKDLVSEMIAPRHLVRMDGAWSDVRGLAQAQDPKRALRQRAVQLALADPMKVFVREVYDWSLETLWGPSALRNQPDRRYPRPYPPAASDGDADYLTPRHALQQLGTEFGRSMHEDTWVRQMIRAAEELLGGRRTLETERGGHILELVDLVVVSDVRFVNEAKVVREAGGELWVIDRPNPKAAAGGEAWRQHASEQSFAAVREHATHILLNDDSIETLRGRVAAALVARGV